MELVTVIQIPGWTHPLLLPPPCSPLFFCTRTVVLGRALGSPSRV